MPASFGVHGPGETTTRSGCAREQLVDGGLVVAHDVELGAELAEVLHEVVRERVVVVDHQDAPHGAHHQSACVAASSIARLTARALFTDSSNS